MDCPRVRRSLSLALFILLTSACARPKTEETVFPKVSSACLDQARAHRYLVRWVTGHVTLEQESDEERFRREFVRKNLQNIDHVEPDFTVKIGSPSQLQGAPFQVLTTADNWAAKRIEADQAWLQGAKGQGVIVAVIDSGVDVSHPQLINQIAYNKGEYGLDSEGQDRRFNLVDDDNNGLVDDYAGYNFSNNSGDLRDSSLHGTHVSGVIAAEHSDQVAGPQNHVQGIAPEARVLPLAFIDESGSGSLFDAMRAIEYAVARGSRVINASWGGAGCSSLLRDQISQLQEKGVIFVSAAGNSSLNIDYAEEYPAAFNLASQITVGAVGTFDHMTNYSNYGLKAVHIFAPGSEIISTIPQGQMSSMSGTSMATPFVSGAIAVLWGRYPDATIDQIRLALYRSAAKDDYYLNASRGRIALGRALSELGRLLTP